MQSWPRPKDPDDIRFYGFDWSSWLGDQRTAIVTSTFIVADSTLTTSNGAINGGITSFRAQGGSNGEAAKITNRVTFDNGEQVDETNTLRIRSN